MPRRYGPDGTRLWYGKAPEDFTQADVHRFMAETEAVLQKRELLGGRDDAKTIAQQLAEGRAQAARENAPGPPRQRARRPGMTDKGTSGQSVQKSPKLTEGLFLMDGIEGLRSLPRHSVDMLLTDPPYGTTRNYWDVPLPLPELWEAVKWAVKPDGAILFFAQCPYDKVLGASNLSMLRYEWVWYKKPLYWLSQRPPRPTEKDGEHPGYSIRSSLFITRSLNRGKPYKRSLTNNGGQARTMENSSVPRAARRMACAFRGTCSRSLPSSAPSTPRRSRWPCASISSRPTPAPASWWRTSARAPAQRRWPPSTRGRRFICFETVPAYYAAASERIRVAGAAVEAGEKGV